MTKELHEFNNIIEDLSNFIDKIDDEIRKNYSKCLNININLKPKNGYISDTLEARVVSDFQISENSLENLQKEIVELEQELGNLIPKIARLEICNHYIKLVNEELKEIGYPFYNSKTEKYHQLSFSEKKTNQKLTFWTKNTNLKSIQAITQLYPNKAGFSEIIDFIEQYKQKEKEILMPIISKYLSCTVALAIIFLAICAAITLTIIYVSPIIHGFNTIILELMAAIATVAAFTPLFISEEYFNLYTKINKIHRPISDEDSYMNLHAEIAGDKTPNDVNNQILNLIKSNQNDPSKKDIKMPALQKISLQEIYDYKTMQI